MDRPGRQRGIGNILCPSGAKGKFVGFRYAFERGKKASKRASVSEFFVLPLLLPSFVP